MHPNFLFLCICLLPLQLFPQKKIKNMKNLKTKQHEKHLRVLAAVCHECPTVYTLWPHGFTWKCSLQWVWLLLHCHYWILTGTPRGSPVGALCHGDAVASDLFYRFPAPVTLVPWDPLDAGFWPPGVHALRSPHESTKLNKKGAGEALKWRSTSHHEWHTLEGGEYCFPNLAWPQGLRPLKVADL